MTDLLNDEKTIWTVESWNHANPQQVTGLTQAMAVAEERATAEDAAVTVKAQRDGFDFFDCRTVSPDGRWGKWFEDTNPGDTGAVFDDEADYSNDE